MAGLKTRFNEYVCFSSRWFDQTPDAEDDSGEIDIPTVTLDGQFTIEDLRLILDAMEKHVKEFNATS